MNSEFLQNYFKNNLISNFNIIKFSQKYLNNFRLIFFSSIACLGMQNNSHYSAAKAALESLVKSASIELSNTLNRVYCIRLGAVEINKDKFSKELKIQHDKLQENLLKRTIGNKKISKEEIYGLVDYLLKNEQNSLHSEIIPLSSGFGLF